MAQIPFQSTYNANQEAGLAGGLVNGEDFNAFSRTVETAAGIGFGKPVAQGAADRGCILFASGGTFLGITRRNPAVDPINGDKYAQYTEASVIDFGVVRGLVGAAVTARSQVRWDTVAGKFTGAAASGTVLDCPGCTFDAAAAQDTLAIIRVRRP